jgi:hypothetical protein
MEMINNMIHDFKVNVSFLSKLVEGLNFSLIIPYVTYHLKIITILQILRYKSKSNVSNSRYFRINSYLYSCEIWSFSVKKIIIFMLILLTVMP